MSINIDAVKSLRDIADLLEAERALVNEAYEALEQAETEMRYAGWNGPYPDDVGRPAAYKAVVRIMKLLEGEEVTD